MYADARISPARINWRQGSGYKNTPMDIRLRSVMKTRIDRLIETVSRCILDESESVGVAIAMPGHE